MKAKHANTKIKSLKCFSCGEIGHKSNVCPAKKSSKLWCSHCKTSTHSEKACRKKNKDNAAKKSAVGIDKQEEHSYSFFKVSDADLFLESKGNEAFLVDCGATTHIVNNDCNFVYIDETFKPSDHYIELADGTRQNNIAKKRGTVEVTFCDKAGKLVISQLENTLFIPSYPQCIFSVQAATKKGAKLTFNGDSAELVNKDGVCFPVKQHGQLYYLCKASSVSVCSYDISKWHQILGHCNQQDVLKVENVVSGMRITNKDKFDCNICTLAKQTNTRNRQPDSRATEPFELVHTDLAGPITPTSKGGFRYCIVFTDDFTGTLFTYFLKQKSDSVKAVQKFLADISPLGKVKTLSFSADLFPHGDVKRVRSDNGGEYVSQEFREILIKNQIRQEFSSPNSAHQNGTAERSWRSLFEMGRSMLIQSSLPQSLWTYAVMTATHIRNRCYSQRIENTPYGLITGIKPDFSKLHIFGTVCYGYIHGHKKKLDARCEQGIFVGYDKESPAYLVYNPKSGAVNKIYLILVS